ncbi:hypothetical protein GFS24_26725 [Chitinophaga sp. SYP-B3965]|uniref:hypothetical protein n=1 Tax=Chitinophaga sp. SYP-B3965 TaxID=2663120 RepID=UPI0012999D78|nr:hypothetical protein [Chitinophaga sp. SYP-B3965]MRG48735.1 hypothetical protein [Chitinophaga sp. SYP-B3965]
MSDQEQQEQVVPLAPLALPAHYCEFILDEELMNLGARLLSLKIVRSTIIPNGPAMIQMKFSMPTKKKVLANTADPDARGVHEFTTRQHIPNALGIETHMKAVGDESVEVEYEHDSGGKIPNTPAPFAANPVHQ